MKFIKAEDVFNILECGLKTGKNIVLYGPGGHGKSEMTAHFFQQQGINPFTLAFGEGMTEERLLGGIDMPLFQKTGKVQYLLENSFIDHEYVVFEELFDAPVNVLLTLKDILTSKKVRNGTQVRDVKCRLIVACTNRSAEGVGTDLSSRALLERFPLRLEVKWDDYSEKSFLDLINIVNVSLDNVDKSFLAKVFALHHERGYFISPRTAVHAVQVFRDCGIQSLKYIGDINADVLQEAVSQYDKIKQVALQKEQLNEILKKTKSIISDSKSDAVSKIKLLKEVKKELTRISFYDENSGDYKTVSELVNNSIQKFVNEL